MTQNVNLGIRQTEMICAPLYEPYLDWSDADRILYKTDRETATASARKRFLENRGFETMGDFLDSTNCQVNIYGSVKTAERNVRGENPIYKVTMTWERIR